MGIPDNNKSLDSSKKNPRKQQAKGSRNKSSRKTIRSRDLHQLEQEIFRKLIMERYRVLLSRILNEKDEQVKRQLVRIMIKYRNKSRIQIPSKHHVYCKYCQAPRTSSNTRIRLDSKKKVKILKCLNCNKIVRIPYHPKRERQKQ